jgi:hypothetical protein
MIVTDTGPIIAFARVRRLDMLRDVVGRLLIPDASIRIPKGIFALAPRERPLTMPCAPLSVASRRRPSCAGPAAPPARRGCLLQPLAPRWSATRRCRARRRRSGGGSASGVLQGRGPRDGNGLAQVHRGDRHRRGAHVASGPTLAWASANAKSSCRQRAGAMGGTRAGLDGHRTNTRPANVTLVWLHHSAPLLFNPRCYVNHKRECCIIPIYDAVGGRCSRSEMT